MALSDILFGLLLLFILSGYVLIPLTFLLIILLMKRSRKRKKQNGYNIKPMPWSTLLAIQFAIDMTVSPIWMFFGSFVGVMTTDSPGSTPLYFYTTVICAIVTVILNIILLRVCIVGINKQRKEVNMQPTLWPYALIIIYIFAIPGRFIYAIFH
ncbi:hypothetical protein O3797_03395 [Gemella sanguinis]|jgi:hypothetical protein|uniref:hypothetical protein n=1 Tax=Gemella sanguinis TaxID=84135 RepID=UPI00352C1709